MNVTLTLIAAFAGQFPIGRNSLRHVVTRSRRYRAAVLWSGSVGKAEGFDHVRTIALEREVEARRVAGRVRDLVDNIWSCCLVLVNVQSSVSPAAIENVTALVVVLVERFPAGTVLTLQSMLVNWPTAGWVSQPLPYMASELLTL
jgi:hypothetical protein